MLRALSLQNFMLFPDVTWDFAEGFSVITGESGAGKSLVFAAVGMVLGDRMSADFIGPNDGPCRLRAVFELPQQHGVWEELGSWGVTPPETADDAWLIIQREMTRDARSSTRVQGRIVPVQALRQIAPLLVVLNTQHHALEAVEPSALRDWLDSFAGLGPLRQQMREAVDGWRKARAELDRYESERLTSEEAQTLRLTLEEIDALHLQDNDDVLIGEQLKEFRTGQRLWEAYHEVRQLLDGSDVGLGIDPLLENLRHVVESMVRIDSRLQSMLDVVVSVQAQVADWGLDVGRWANNLQWDTQELSTLEERADQIARIKRKLGMDLKGILDERDRLRSVLADYERSEWEIEQARRRKAEAEQKVEQASFSLTRARQEMLITARDALLKLLSEMELPNAVLEFILKPVTVGIYGGDEVDMLFSANPGQASRSLAKTASGGEVARMALALAVTGGGQRHRTYLFDEVDAGLGGVSAARVGDLLRRLGDGNQVIAISHQPTVAARAHHHWIVRKAIQDGVSFASSEPLTGRRRADEIVRMLSGEETSYALRHAQELLEKEDARD